jgi:hypothetical protein
MKRLAFLIALLAANFVHAQSDIIHWKDKVVVHDAPPVALRDTSRTAMFRSSYGSEYGRMLKLANGKWLAGYTISRNTGYQKDPRGGFELEIAESSDDGKTWRKIAVLSDPGRDLDNVQMLQLHDGAIVLACRSVRWQESYRLPVYKSKDNGRTWQKISMIDSNEGKPGELGKPDKGVYEPHLYLLDDGRVAVMYANEKHVTDSVSYSQIISQKISSDKGQTWGPEIWVAHQPGYNSSRPGMPVWTKMKNGKFIAVYEICGPQDCNVYYKTSEDGIGWPVGLGTLIHDQTGGPYILSLTNGTLVVTSNKGNVSVSKDFGETWELAERAFEHKKDFTKDWHQTIWCSIYQFGEKEIGIMTSLQRESGGHNVQLRLGTIN